MRFIRKLPMQIKHFLKAVAIGDSPVVLTVREVDAFLQSLGEQDGYSRVSLQTVAGCLRSFCRYAATRGWCEDGVADAIKTPRVYSLDSVPSGPSWEDVKRLLALTEGDKPTNLLHRALDVGVLVEGGIGDGRHRIGDVLRQDQPPGQSSIVVYFHSPGLSAMLSCFTSNRCARAPYTERCF